MIVTATLSSFTRRSLVLAALLATSLPGRNAAAAGGAGDGPPDVDVFCDPTLGPVLRQAGALFKAQTRAPVAVFSTPPQRMQAQLEHGVRDDVLITLQDAMDRAVRKGLAKPETRIDGWRNPLVLAAPLGQPVPDVTNPDRLARWLGDGRLAITDPTVAASFDGLAVLDRLGLSKALAGKITGAANTGDVAFLVKTGAARLGLLYLTDVRANPGLNVVATLDAAVGPTAFSFALSSKAQSPDAQAFLDFLQTPAVVALLRTQGLERTA